ncbi:MAG: hypothetical protein GX088_06110 [Clostridia bacterium]|nr:hypothetical protein [Clostridia bacterium]
MKVKIFYLCWFFLITTAFVFIGFEHKKISVNTKGVFLVMVRNCEETVENVLRILCARCWRRGQGPIFVIVEDSDDKTKDIVTRLSRKHSEINVLFRKKDSFFDFQHIQHFLDQPLYLLDLRNFVKREMNGYSVIV